MPWNSRSSGATGTSTTFTLAADGRAIIAKRAPAEHIKLTSNWVSMRVCVMLQSVQLQHAANNCNPNDFCFWDLSIAYSIRRNARLWMSHSTSAKYSQCKFRKETPLTLRSRDLHGPTMNEWSNTFHTVAHVANTIDPLYWLCVALCCSAFYFWHGFARWMN